MEALIVIPLLTVLLTLMLWGIVQTAKRNHVSLPKTNRTGTLAAIDEMVEMDGQASDILVDRVAGWRGRLLRSLVSTFRGGSLSVSEYEGEVDRVVRATEPEAIALAAKKAGADEMNRRAERERKEREARKLREWNRLYKTLRTLLNIDATPYRDTLDGTYDYHIVIGGVQYSVREVDDWSHTGKRQDVIVVSKQCAYCHNLVNGHNNITTLAHLGWGLEKLEKTKACESMMCRWRAEGLTEKEVSERYEKYMKSQPKGGDMAHYYYPQFSGVYGFHDIGFSHVPYDLWQRPITYRDVTSETA